MIAESDNYGIQRNRQPEFFFFGIIGHVRSFNSGRINSWSAAARLANYWRRYYRIPEVHGEYTSWNSSAKTTMNRLTMLTTQPENQVKSKNPTWKMTPL